MTEPPVAPASASSFLDRALDKTPAFVVSVIGSMLGISLCLIAVLQLGGLQVPVNNYLTSRLAPQVQSLDHSATLLASTVTRLDELVRRLERNEAAIADHERRLNAIETWRARTWPRQ